MKYKITKLWIFISIAIALSAVLTSSCKKGETVKIPVVTSTSVSAITESTATTGGTIMPTGVEPLRRAVCAGILLSIQLPTTVRLLTVQEAGVLPARLPD